MIAPCDTTALAEETQRVTTALRAAGQHLPKTPERVRNAAIDTTHQSTNKNLTIAALAAVAARMRLQPLTVGRLSHYINHRSENNGSPYTVAHLRRSNIRHLPTIQVAEIAYALMGTHWERVRRLELQTLRTEHCPEQHKRAEHVLAVVGQLGSTQRLVMLEMLLDNWDGPLDELGGIVTALDK